MRDIALAMFILGMIPFILTRPYIGLLVWSWLGYMNPNRLTYGFAYNFPWVQLIAVVTLVSFLASKESKRILSSSVTALLIALLLWTGFTTIFAAVPGPALSKWEEFAKILVMVFMTLILVNTRQRMHWLMWVIAVSLGFYGIKGGLFTITHGGVYHVIGPPASFIGDNNALALALCMTIPLMRYLHLHTPQKFVRVGLSGAMLLTGITVLGTYSRGGLIALAITVGALFLKSRRRVAVVATVVVLGLVAYHFMPPKWTARMSTLQDATQVSSAETRIQSWEFAANVAVHRPIRGGGFEVYRSASMWQAYAPEGAVRRAIHSIYFRVLGEQGFIGLALYLALLLASWRNCSRVRKLTRNVPDTKWAFDLASMLQVSLVAYAAAGAFLPMPYFDLVYQLIAVTALLRAWCNQKLRDEQAASPVRAERAVVREPHALARDA